MDNGYPQGPRLLDSSKNDRRRNRATAHRIIAAEKDSISPGKAEVRCQKKNPMPVKAITRTSLAILEPRWLGTKAEGSIGIYLSSLVSIITVVYDNFIIRAAAPTRQFL
jgi:hypothetical protein